MVHWLQKEEAMVVALLGTETTKNGQRVAGGMYIVLSATAEGESSVVTKIAIIR